MVLVFTGHANESIFVQKEVQVATSQGLLLIPLRIEDLPLSKSLRFNLATTQWLDAVTGDLVSHLPELVTRLSRVWGDTKESETETRVPVPLPPRADEEFWNCLLQDIAERKVIPIIGPNAVVVKGEYGRRPFYEYVARRAEVLLELAPTPLRNSTSPLDVARRFLYEQKGELSDLYYSIGCACREEQEKLETLPITLAQLAGLGSFKLFATTTFDDLPGIVLAQRGFGTLHTLVLAYSHGRTQDLPSPVTELEHPVLVHLFGRASVVPDYVVTEEDVYEWTDSLQLQYGGPSLLLDELNSHSLLILGVGGADWLRPILRVVNRRPFDFPMRHIYVVDSKIHDASGLTGFLRRGDGREMLVAEDEASFVSELVERWLEYRPRGTRAIPPREKSREPTGRRKPLVPVSHIGEPLLDPENPWPGLESFAERDAAFFCGREKEVQLLLRLVRRERVTILFGRAGLGKSSLLNAGLSPALRAEYYLPVRIRLAYGASNPPLRNQVLQALAYEAEREAITAPPSVPDRTLWEHFNRRNAAYRTHDGSQVIPVLMLDQFEEAFTLGRRTRQDQQSTAAFLEELSDVVEARAPAAIKARLDAHPEDVELFDFVTPSCKVLISLREDFLAELESLRGMMPSLMTNRMVLAPLCGDAALLVTTHGGPELVSPAVGERIVRSVAGDRDGESGPELPIRELVVEPALLSLFCRELNERRKAIGAPRLDDNLVQATRSNILGDYYLGCLADLEPAVRTFVEERLVSVSGFRESIALDNALALPGITQAVVETLISRRLIRMEMDKGRSRLELTHDVLAPVVQHSRDSRRSAEHLGATHREPTAGQAETARRSWLRRLM